MAGATTTNSPLVSADWLAERLDSPDLVILDATFFLPAQGRSGAEEYRQCHIPGAQFFDIDQIADPHTDLPHMLPDESTFSRAAGKLGIEEFTTVVVYDNNDFMAAARAWWTFRTFDHDHVVVLDGGLFAWLARGLPVSSVVEAAAPASFNATYRPGLVRNMAQMMDLQAKHDIQVVDARPADRFSGQTPEPRPGLRSGHIPGSHNLFFRHLIDERSHCLKAPDSIAAEFFAAGIDPARPVITTCGSGVTAAILALGLFRIGNEYAALYDGSWAEWGRHKHTPVSTPGTFD